MMSARLKRIIAVAGAAACFLSAKPQDVTPLSSLYFDLQSLYNPAAAGMGASLKIALDGRLDSIGHDEAPRSFTALADGGMDFGSARLGAALSFLRGKAAESSPMATTLSVSVGYRLGGGLISFGLSGGLLRNKIYTESSLNGEDKGDSPTTDNNRANSSPVDDRPRARVSTFDMGAGIYYNYRGLWLSASALHLLDPKFRYRKTGFAEDENNLYPQQLVTAAHRTFYFSGGYNISLKKSLFDLEPSFFVSTNSLNTCFQATARLKYRKLVQFGVGYRSKNIAMVIAGVEYKGFHLAYSYDCGLRPGKDGPRLQAHEIMAWYAINLDLSKKKTYGRKSVRIL